MGPPVVKGRQTKEKSSHLSPLSSREPLGTVSYMNPWGARRVTPSNWDILGEQNRRTLEEDEKKGGKKAKICSGMENMLKRVPGGEKRGNPSVVLPLSSFLQISLELSPCLLFSLYFPEIGVKLYSELAKPTVFTSILSRFCAALLCHRNPWRPIPWS